MTVITAGRRCNPFSLPAIALAFIVVFGLYAWSMKLEERLEVLSSVLRQGPDGLGVTDEDVAPEWGLGGTETGGVALQAEGPVGLVPEDADADEDEDEDEDEEADTPSWGDNIVVPVDGSGSLAPESPSTPLDLAVSQPFDCHSYPGAESVLLVMKTGATELLRRLPVHLLTTFSCVPDYLIFSSIAQTVGGVPVHDALANISDAHKSSDSTMQTLYPKLKEYHYKGWDVSSLAQGGSWDLDKWKNIPMALESYRLHPTKNWFVFIDADSAVIWPNLLHMLSKLDAELPHYLGSPVYIGDTHFAHGGSGYVVSGAALQMLSEMAAEKKLAWEQRTAEVCCGDMMFAEALRDAGVGLTDATPAAYGGSPRTVEWTSDTWCKAPVFFHHMRVEEVEELWSWEQSWLEVNGKAAAKPILFGDLFYHFVGQYLLGAQDDGPDAESASYRPDASRTGWSNMAGKQSFSRPDQSKEEAVSDEKAATEPYASADKCLERCQAEEWCLQWSWAPNQCSLGDVPALGKTPRSEWDHGDESMDNVVSGWLKDRIAHYIGKFGECPAGSEF